MKLTLAIPLDPTKAKSRAAYPHPTTLYALAADPATGRLYAGSDDYGIHVFDLASPKKEPVARWTRHENYVSALVHAKNVLVSGSYDQRLIWWDTAKGEPLRTVEAHQGWIRDLVATPDGELLASAGDDMLVKIWETATGRLVRTLEGHAKQTPQGHVTALYMLAMSPDGKYVASADRIGAVCVWEMATGKLAQRLDVPVLYTYDPRQRKRSIGGIRALAFSPDGQHLAMGGIGQVNNVDGLGGPAHIEIWNWRQPRQCLAAGAEAHRALLDALRFHPGGQWLIGGGGGTDNGVLAFWKVDGLASLKEAKDSVTVHRIKTDGHIRRICFSPNGRELYAAGFRKLEVWSLG